MLKLKFQVVLDYVRDGEADEGIADMIRRTRGGDDMLRQARILVEALGKASDGYGDDLAFPAQADVEPEPPEGVPSESKARFLGASEAFASFDLADDPIGASPEPGGDRLAAAASRAPSLLGELCMTFRGDRWQVTHTSNLPASEAAPPGRMRRGADTQRRPKSASHLYRARQAREGIRIHGHGIALVVDTEIPADGGLTITTVDLRHAAPAANLTVIYMPKSGPFVRDRTDSRGIVRLASLTESGTLRIEAERPLILHVRVVR